MRPDTNERPRLPVLEQLRDEFLRRLLAEQHAMAEGSFGQRGGLVGGSAADCGLGAQRGEEQALARRAASYFAAPAFETRLAPNLAAHGEAGERQQPRLLVGERGRDRRRRPSRSRGRGGARSPRGVPRP